MPSLCRFSYLPWAFFRAAVAWWTHVPSLWNTTPRMVVSSTVGICTPPSDQVARGFLTPKTTTPHLEALPGLVVTANWMRHFAAYWSSSARICARQAAVGAKKVKSSL